jgi:hypothetical protein
MFKKVVVATSMLCVVFAFVGAEPIIWPGGESPVCLEYCQNCFITHKNGTTVIMPGTGWCGISYQCGPIMCCDGKGPIAKTMAETRACMLDGEASLTATFPSWLHIEIEETIGAVVTLSGVSVDRVYQLTHVDVDLVDITANSPLNASIDFDMEKRLKLESFFTAFSEDAPMIADLKINFNRFSLSTRDPELILSPFEAGLSLRCEAGNVLAAYSAQLSLADVFAGYMRTTIEQISASGFSSPEKQDALLDKIDEFIAQFREGAWIGAKNRLENDIMGKMRVRDSGSGEGRWITDEFTASNVHGAFSKMLAVMQYLAP